MAVVEVVVSIAMEFHMRAFHEKVNGKWYQALLREVDVLRNSLERGGADGCNSSACLSQRRGMSSFRKWPYLF